MAIDPTSALRTVLREFVHGVDHDALVIRAGETETLVTGKLLAAAGAGEADDVYLVFLSPCEQVGAYLDAIVARLDEEIAAANGLRDQARLPRWRALPLAVRDARRPAADRLRLLVEHCDTLVAAGHRIVWGFVPSPLVDVPGFEAMVAPLADVPVRAGRHRFVVRDDAARGSIVADLARAGRDDVLVLDLDMSLARHYDDCAAIACDPNAPRDERLAAALELAAADLAHGRPAAALEKYAALFDAFAGQPVRQAQCLCSAAGIAMQGGDATTALHYAQRGLPIATAAGSLVMLRPLLVLAGQASQALARHADAAGYFDLANHVAGKCHDPYAKADALEQRGVSELAGGRAAAAAKTWEVCARLSQQFGYEDRWRSAMGRLAALYDAAGMRPQSRDAQRRIADGMAGPLPP